MGFACVCVCVCTGGGGRDEGLWVRVCALAETFIGWLAGWYSGAEEARNYKSRRTGNAAGGASRGIGEGVLD